MLTDEQRRVLESAWDPARASGVLGPASISELEAHAAGFVPAALPFSDDGRLSSSERWRDRAMSSAGDLGEERLLQGIDLGTGAGVPGVLLAAGLPSSRWRLVDRDLSRCRLAEAAVSALGLSDRVSVVHGRIDELGREPTWRASADLVVARLFGSASEVVENGVPLLGSSGSLVVSVARSSLAAWLEADLTALAARIGSSWETEAGVFVQVCRVGTVDRRFPRRPPARRRAPVLPF